MMQTQTYAYGPAGKALCALATNAIDDEETKNKKIRLLKKNFFYFHLSSPM